MRLGPTVTAVLLVVLGGALGAVTNIGTGLPLPEWTQSPVLIGFAAVIILVSMVWLTVRQQRLSHSSENSQPNAVAQSRPKPHRKVAGPIVLLLVALPANVVVWLNMLDPVQFSPIALPRKALMTATSYLGLSSSAPEWLYVPAQWLASRPSLAGWLVAIALFLWAGCRPPLDSYRGYQPSSWLVTAGWISALAAVTCDAGRWLVAAYVGIMAALTLLRSQLLKQSVRDCAENMQESLILAIFLPTWMALAVISSIVPRFTGRSRRAQLPKQQLSMQDAGRQMLELGYWRVEYIAARDQRR